MNLNFKLTRNLPVPVPVTRNLKLALRAWINKLEEIHDPGIQSPVSEPEAVSSMARGLDSMARGLEPREFKSESDSEVRNLNHVRVK